MSEVLQDKDYRKYLSYDPGHCVAGCELCLGLGYVRPLGGALGKLVQCPNKPFQWDDRTGLTTSEVDYFMGIDYKRLDNSELINAALERLEEKGKGLLYVHGEPGTCKTTTVARWFINTVRKGCSDAFFTTHSNMVDWLRASYDEKAGQSEYRNRLKEITGRKLLVIDELTRDRLTDFGLQVLNEIIDARYKMALSSMRMTVFVSNFAPEEKLDGYQVDRIQDGRFEIVVTEDTSIRPAMEWDNG